MYYPIDEATAQAAHNMTYSREYIPGEATQDYRNQVDKAAQLVEDQKKQVSTFYHDKLDSLLESYSRKLAQWINASNRNGASCPSILISGAGNFPVRKKEKQNARADALWKEYQEIESILARIRAVGTGPIDFNDPHAAEMLEERVKSYTEELERDKALNAYYRKHQTFTGFPGMTEERTDRLNASFEGLRKRCPYVTKPFPDYTLTNLRGRLKRAKERLEDFQKLQQEKQNPTEAKQVEGCEIVRNPENNRLQLFFDQKPDDEMRARLKSEGFRWSPRNKAWQRQLTDNAERAVKRIFGEV